LKAFKTEVQEVRNRLPKPKGAFGRRHISRGLTSFYDKAKAARRPVAEFAGIALFEKLIEMGETEEAEKVFEQLSK